MTSDLAYIATIAAGAALCAMVLLLNIGVPDGLVSRRWRLLSFAAAAVGLGVAAALLLALARSLG
jgi:hypothetical protein